MRILYFLLCLWFSWEILRLFLFLNEISIFIKKKSNIECEIVSFKKIKIKIQLGYVIWLYRIIPHVNNNGFGLVQFSSKEHVFVHWTNLHEQLGI